MSFPTDVPAADEEIQPPAPKRRAAVTFIFVTIALDMLAMGMIAPVLPRLITEFAGGSEAHGAEIFGLFGTVWAVMQFFFSPLLGSLSDRFGRRPVILLSNLGLGLDYVVMALSPNLAWLFAGRLISGITSSSIPTAMAYIADVTPPKKRAEAFGMVSAAFGLGFVLGPALGGILGNYSARLPFWVAGGMSLLNATYGFFVLPESLGKEHRGRFSWKRANPVGSLTLLRRHRELLGLASVLFLSYLTQQSLMNTWVLYLDYRFSWTNRAVGLSLALVGICSATVGGFLVRPAIKRLGDRNTLLAGIGIGWIGFAIFGLAPTGLIFLSGIPIMALWGLCGPPAQGLMTRHVEANEQGQLQGAVQCIRGLTALIGPSMFTFVFAAAIRPTNRIHLPGAPFLLAAAILLSALPLALVVTKREAAA
ncbi:DHA1 family tetracycline resistance protein-like MFS transporter [Silvibacterium bohemicum]|uniref:DHA1 family tetracycline resistance protein-like MFS transporter n=1 Tax=Silvibacterium bohemicum TaxID=1577686 RepID=A0A841K5U7_9BACT|nr:TCR/Tet family MFS transporter [Silvibacterium bohemicum]MBB6146511.1 DHA1 family tetracycline resistance protein-like MFS transporter [Silvibacterium bohemicum]